MAQAKGAHRILLEVPKGWLPELAAAAEEEQRSCHKVMLRFVNANVLATGPHGRRVAFEVQVSSIGANDAAERTRRLTASGVQVCWFNVRGGRTTLADLPSVAAFDVEGEGWQVHPAVWEGSDWHPGQHGCRPGCGPPPRYRSRCSSAGCAGPKRL